jgi:hypothetical protein
MERCINPNQTYQASNQGVSFQEVQNDIQLPDNAQIILTTDLEIPGTQACAAPKNGDRDVKCWVCRAKKSNNDVLYMTEKNSEGVPQKIMPIEKPQLSSDGNEIIFYIHKDSMDDDDLSSILCKSKRPFQIRNRSELIPLLETNGLKLILPAPRVK